MRRSEVPRVSGAVIGGYSVHLYCTHPGHAEYDVRWSVYYGGEFMGETEAGCLSTARRDGWWISRRDPYFARAVLCPYHAREVPR